MLIFVLIAVWSIGAILIAADPDKESTRWASIMTFVGGLGFLSVVIDDTIRPYLYIHASSTTTLDPFLQMLSNICSFTEKTGLPYSFLMFAVSYSNYFSSRQRRRLAVISALPILLMFYIARMFGITEAWEWNILAVLLMFVAFVFFGIKHDIFGIKLRFEKNRLDSAIRAVTSGTILLNHTIKNEVGKIHLFLDRIHAYAAVSERQNMDRDIQTILDSTHNLLHLANQFHKQSQDIALKESSNSLLDIAHEAIAGLKPLLETKQTKVHIDFPSEPHVTCDKFHIRETLTNILMNASEAIPSDGAIAIKLSESNKYLTLSVQDNGHGIEKENLPYVFDPFFSTKNSLENYGLGLSYCYNAMHKHGGFLDIHSVKNVGTTVFLHFPKSKLTYASQK